MINSKSKQKKSKKKSVRFKYGNFASRHIYDTEIEDGQIISDDSDQDNTIQAKEATSENSKAVKKIAATQPTEDADNAAPTINSKTSTDGTIKNTDEAVSKEAVSKMAETTQHTAQAVPKPAVINEPASTQANEQMETATEEETQRDAEAEHTETSNTSQEQQCPTIPDHPPLTSENIRKESMEKITKLYVGNITADTTEEDIMQLFGLNTTTYLRNNTKIQVFHNTNSKTFAILQLFYRHAVEIIKLNGLEFKSRNLVIEIAKNPPKFDTDTSIVPYNRGDMRRGKDQQNNLDTSKKNKAKAVRPAPASSSRQEETHIQPDFWDQCLEAVGEKELNEQSDKTMAQKLREKHKRQELERKGQRQLLLEIECDQSRIPKNALPNASLVYGALTEQMGLTDESSDHQVEAIFQPDPNNFWKWSVVFSSQSLKDNFEGKEAEISWTDRTNKQYNYIIRTHGAPRRLLVTIKSSPFIDDDELRQAFRFWGVVKGISHKGCDFAPHIDSGLRKVFLHLHQGVNPESIPGFITLSDGVYRKLYFRGKKYLCVKCSTTHTYREGCAEQLPQESVEETNNNTTQEKTTNEQQQMTNTQPQMEDTPTATKQQKRNSTISGRNRTTTENATEQTTNTHNVPINKDNNERGEENFEISGMPSASQQSDFPLSPCVLTTVIPETPVTVIGETPTSQIHGEGNKKAIPAAKHNTKAMVTNRKEKGSQPRRAVMVEPLYLPPWKR